MIAAELAEAAAALERKQPVVVEPQWTDPAFPEQGAFIEDDAHLISLLCTRRAGKSLGIGRKLVKTAWRKAGVSCLYIALTRDSAKKIMWKDVLKVINREMNLGARFNETELTMTLPNGSVIYLLGVDSDEEQKQKLLGQKYAGVAIDEAASFTIDLAELVYRVVDPATVDLDGWIALTGTPGNLKRGLFFEVTKGQDPQQPGRWTTKHADTAGAGAGTWSGHRWNTARNPFMAKKWEAAIARLREAAPRIEETPGFQQEYLGRWVIDDSKLVYRYAQGRNDFTELPRLARGRWHYVLGCDLGYNDATSLTVCAYHDHDPVLYVLESEKHERLDITDVARRAKAIGARYDLDAWVIDNANKQAVEEMRKRHEIPWRAADKTGKADFIEIMNGEFILGRIKLSAAAQPLKDEYAGLIWDDRSSKREEHPNCPNHCADGALYAWRYAYAYLSQSQPERPTYGSDAWGAQVEAELESAAEETLRRQQEPEGWEWTG